MKIKNKFDSLIFSNSVYYRGLTQVWLRKGCDWEEYIKRLIEAERTADPPQKPLQCKLTSLCWRCNMTTWKNQKRQYAAIATIL